MLISMLYENIKGAAKAVKKTATFCRKESSAHHHL